MKSSPTEPSWWERFKEAVRSLPDSNPTLTPDEPWPRGPVNHAADDIARAETLLEETIKLRAEVKTLRTQLLASKHNERQLAWRIEAFRKKWPAIHKDFFTAKGKNNEL